MSSKLFLVALLVGLCYGQETKESLTTSTFMGQKRTHQSGELIFEDEFDSLDMDKWQHEITMGGGGNWEFQVYWNNRSNSYTRDSTLYLQPTLTADRFGEDFVYNGHLELWGGQPNDYCTSNGWYGCDRTGMINPIASARLRTVDSFSFKYGRVVARAQIPSGDWIWPAIWMLPTKLAYGQWPSSGEIDIMESRGNLNYVLDGVNIGAEQYGATLHYGIDYTMNGWPKAHFDSNTPAGAPWSNAFHDFEVEWTPDYFKFSVDGVETGTVTVPAGGFWELGNFANEFPGVANPWEGEETNAPFNQEFYLLLNVAVGGVSYFSDEAVNTPFPKPWSNESPQASLDFYNNKDQWYSTWTKGDSAMKVDYVRVYAL